MSESLADIQARFEKLKGENLSLDMTRGKPCSEQLDLSNDLLKGVSSATTPGGVDTRNYGGLDGLPELKALFGEVLGVPTEQMLIGGNSSLNLMADFLIMCSVFGVAGGKPWKEQGTVKFICPVPGYDRHFTVCERLSIEMITVPMNSDGPDMDAVEKLAADDSVKGIWLVPRYANPTGTTISKAVGERLAKMKAAADFRIMWDNAYVVHELVDDPEREAPIYDLCKAAGNEDRAICIGSTSKVTFAGAGIGYMGMSEANKADFVKFLQFRTIGPNKVNQLAHLNFLKDVAGIKALMKKHAALIKPKFDAVLSILDKELSSEYGVWSNPKGGYFISFDTAKAGIAGRIVELAGDLGVKLTPAGATFPYQKDPENRNIRLAPTFPSQAEVEKASEVFAVCVKLATLEAK